MSLWSYFSSLGWVPVLLPLTFFFFFFLNSNFLILECSCLHGLGFLLTSDTSHTQQKGSAVVVNSCNQSVWTLYRNTPLFLRNNCLLSLQERRGRRCSSQHSGGLHVLSIQRFVCRHFSGGILPDWTQRHQQEVRLTAAFTVFQSKHRPWPPCLGVSDPQVLLQRHSSVGHFERRRGATARVFRPLPHPGGIHWGLHGRLDQQKYAFHGIRGCYFIKAPHSAKRLAHFCVFGPSSLLVHHPDLQLPLNWEHQPATRHQQPMVTVMPLKCCYFWWCRKCMNVFMCSDWSTGRKNALYPSISSYKSETSSKFSSGLFYLSFKASS